MDINTLSRIMRECGVVGAGGAGFPSYAKLNAAADTIILNCAECEPLLKLHRQVLSTYADEIVSTLEIIADTLSADSVIIAVKHAYTEAVEAVRKVLPKYRKTRIGFLPEIYPAGDEVVTIYETTGRVVNPGALPISVGCIVFNVETIYNVHRAITIGAPVTHKYITIAGEVATPCTLKVPLGITYGELIRMAGGATVSDYAIVAGGPMTGRLTSDADVVTKTSNAILVMPRSAYIVQKRLTPVNISAKRAMAACCQCRMCTDLCSRNLLGHPIEPHKIMRAVATGNTTQYEAMINAFSCSACGLCEMYACGQGLDPRSIIGKIKNELRSAGVAPRKGLTSSGVAPTRSMRQVPISRLTARLGLAKYDVPAPLVNVVITAKRVKLMLSQSIGAPSVCTLKCGDIVGAGQVVGGYDEAKLGTAVHSPISGRVTEISEKYVVIEG